MDIRKNCQIEADMIIGNINRMCVTHDPKELDSMFHYAAERLGNLLVMNTQRLESEKKLKEVFK